MKFDVSELTKYANDLPKKVHNSISDATKAVAEFLLEVVTERTPVDTGLLKKTWADDNMHLTVVKRGNWFEVTVKNTTDYASFVEKGHKKVLWGTPTKGWVQGRFFLRYSEHMTSKSLEKIITPYIMRIFEVD